MRRLLVALGIALAASTASAQTKETKDYVKGSGTYGNAGCGLGSLVFGNQPGAVQVLAATTNATFFSQIFGITTGTSNCQPGAFAAGTKDFVEANREAVAKDISRGRGEAIGALTQINACANSSAVGSALQKNFREIFPSENASSDVITEAILRTLHSDPALGCGRS